MFVCVHTLHKLCTLQFPSIYKNNTQCTNSFILIRDRFHHPTPSVIMTLQLFPNYNVYEAPLQLWPTVNLLLLLFVFVFADFPLQHLLFVYQTWAKLYNEVYSILKQSLLNNYLWNELHVQMQICPVVKQDSWWRFAVALDLSLCFVHFLLVFSSQVWTVCWVLSSLDVSSIRLWEHSWATTRTWMVQQVNEALN